MKRTELPAAERLCGQYLSKTTPVLCAVSGGLDSMCLLHFLRAQGYDVSCAHFDHRLRGEDSARDARFVQHYCAENGIPCHLGSDDVRAHARETGESIEEAARHLRYRFLRETARTQGAQLLTAHHADDNAETVLLNLIRGTDLRGLCGMKPMQDGIFRPFLDVTRAELSAYAEANAIPHVEDATNADPAAAARNYLRHEILPRMQLLNPRASEHIAACARSLSALDDSLASESEALLLSAEKTARGISLPLAPVRHAPPTVRARVLLQMADELGVGRKDISRRQLSAALALLAQCDHSVRRLSFPRDAQLIIGHDTITLTRARSLPEQPLLPGETLIWGDFTLSLCSRACGAGLALRALREDERLSVRPCDAGAYLALPGTNGARSVKRLCLDRHIPLSRRDTLPALYVNGRLAAVWPLGIDSAFSPQDSEDITFVSIGEALPCK